jgi:hypothetical protein
MFDYAKLMPPVDEVLSIGPPSESNTALLDTFTYSKGGTVGATPNYTKG